MGLETATYIADLVATNPVHATDSVSQGDDHIRLIKTTLQATFPGLGGRIGRVQTKSGTYTVAPTDNTTLLYCSGAPWTLSLTTAATMGNGCYVAVYNASTSSDLVIDANGTETINGAETLYLPPRCWVILFCNGSSWTALLGTAPTVQQYFIATQNVLCPHKNLKVNYVSAGTVDVDADYVVLFNSNREAKMFASLNETLNIASSGAGGLDTGVEAASTWYHIWAIGKADGTKSCIFSTSSSSPTLPSGYTYYGYLGAIYNNSSSNFRGMYQRGSVVATDYLVVLNSGTATSVTPVDLSAVIPPTATKAVGYGRIIRTGTTGAASGFFGPTSDDTLAPGAQFIQASSLAAGSYINTELTIPLLTPQTAYYSTLAGTTTSFSVWMCGWEY